MAVIHGTAGEWARVKGMVTGLWPLFLGVFACGFSAAVALFANLWAGAALLLCTLVVIFCTLMKGLRHCERFFKGARGEEKVSNILHGLPDEYHVFNDFVAGGAHIDHVVVGPAGVFSVETKNWQGAVTIEEGQVLVDGRLPDRRPLDQARREAALVRQTLSKLGLAVKVTPVLAFASDTFVQHIAEVNGAVVINSCDIADSFSTKTVVIAPDELIRTVTIMENLVDR